MEKLKLFCITILQILIINKQRTLLSMLGVLFGILALVGVGHISDAMKKHMKDTLEKFGPNLIIIRAGEIHVTGRGLRQFTVSQTLNLSDTMAIKTFLKDIEEVVPIVEDMFQVRYKDNIMQVKLIGATKEIVDLRNLIIQDGYFYRGKEEKKGLRKVVLGYKVWQTLFNNEKAFGKTMLIRRVPCEIIGVLAPKGTDLAGDNLDSVIYLPLQTAMRRFFNVDYLSGILVKAKENTNILELKRAITSLLKKRHHLGPLEKDDFGIYALEEIVKTKTQGLSLVSLLSKMAAIISFTVGGLGIFAVMLLSVTERQREIGIRRAVGAKKTDILWQFLGEAIFISLLGGIGGIGFGLIIALIVSLIARLPIIFNVLQLILALSISLGLGIIAGGYPAFLAASLPPLKVLRR